MRWRYPLWVLLALQAADSLRGGLCFEVSEAPGPGDCEDADKHVLLQTYLQAEWTGAFADKPSMPELPHSLQSIEASAAGPKSRAMHVAGFSVFIGLLCLLCLFGSAAGGVLLMLLTSSWSHVSHKTWDPLFGHGFLAHSHVCRPAELEQDPSETSARSHYGDSVAEREEDLRESIYDFYCKKLWKDYHAEEEPNILAHDHLHISRNGGMKGVPKLRIKYVKAVYIVFVLILNFLLIALTDIAIITGCGLNVNNGKDVFLISKRILGSFLNSADAGVSMDFLGPNMDNLVPLLELLYMFGFFATTMLYLGMAVLAPALFTQGKGLQRWTFLSRVFLDFLPHLRTCSALRLLHWVSPTIAYSDGYIAVLSAHQMALEGGTWWHYAHGAKTVLIFVLCRAFAFILGFDAFLVKFRLAANSLHSGSCETLHTIAAATFMWQVFSIIQLDWFVWNRLCIFVFGGKDGKLDIDEQARREVWKGLFCRKVFNTFGMWKGSAVLLALDDYDLQSVIIEDNVDGYRFSTPISSLAHPNAASAPPFARERHNSS